MRTAKHLVDRQNPTSLPLAAIDGDRKSGGRCFPFDRTMGFWLGGFIVGVSGFILGAAFPYHHPVAVAMSMLWWTIYAGALGASAGALLGMLGESTTVSLVPDTEVEPPPAVARPHSKEEVIQE
jgi:hypothetical protein